MLKICMKTYITHAVFINIHDNMCVGLKDLQLLNSIWHFRQLTVLTIETRILVVLLKRPFI